MKHFAHHLLGSWKLAINCLLTSQSSFPISHSRSPKWFKPRFLKITSCCQNFVVCAGRGTDTSVIIANGNLCATISTRRHNNSLTSASMTSTCNIVVTGRSCSGRCTRWCPPHTQWCIAITVATYTPRERATIIAKSRRSIGVTVLVLNAMQAVGGTVRNVPTFCLLTTKARAIVAFCLLYTPERFSWRRWRSEQFNRIGNGNFVRPKSKLNYCQ